MLKGSRIYWVTDCFYMSQLILDCGIEVGQEIDIEGALNNFHTIISIHFSINLCIAVIFWIFFLQKFQKLTIVEPTFILLEYRVGNNISVLLDFKFKYFYPFPRCVLLCGICCYSLFDDDNYRNGSDEIHLHC